MDWMLMPLRRCADFEGRSRRMEYWMFYLFTLLLGLGFMLILGVVVLPLYTMGLSENAMMTIIIPLYFIGFLLSLGLVVPSLAVAVRRLHDQDKSGWFLLLALIPFVGGIIFLVVMCLEGARGPNRFGPDPVEDRRAPGGPSLERRRAALAKSDWLA
jgi:uncharacterized membrane protein YhaH (DUF805 family)